MMKSSFRWPATGLGSGRTRPNFAALADYSVIMMAITLPWSTTIFGIFTVAWIVTLAPSIDIATLIHLLKRPVCALPLALFGLAVIGMFWSDAMWGARLHNVQTLIKLLALPLLVYQFLRSDAGSRVFCAFLGSCIVLMILSWLNWFDPRIAFGAVPEVGVFVKNRITQGQEFVLCIFGAAGLAVGLWRSDRLLAVAAAILSLVFLLNITFVATSRTALISLLLLLPVLSVRFLSLKQFFILCFGATIMLGAIWINSSFLQRRIASIGDQTTRYVDTGEATSAGQRIEYWRKSLTFMEKAPFIGNGTGSIKKLFAEDAVGKSGVSAVVVANPHNQTLYFGVQWGILGIILLFSMWIAHFSAFNEARWICWLGTLIVAQNVVGSLFNSHISDYVEGWLYVLGVGISAGTNMNLRVK